MDQNLHPMNDPNALIARFQFLKIPHGDGLDMNEPSYNKRIVLHISLYSLEYIKEIIEQQDNSYLKDNLYVIPFIYARYGVIPSEEIIEYFKEILSNYQNSQNEIFNYFIENFDSIIRQQLPDDPLQIKRASWFLAFVVSIILWIIIFSIF